MLFTLHPQLYFQILWSEEFADAIFSEHNSEDKTPLQVAIKKGHVISDGPYLIARRAYAA